MEMTQNAYQSFVGIDVSKAKLDVALSPQGTVETIENKTTTIRDLINRRIANLGDTLVVVEATGGYESLVVDCLHSAKIAVAVVNPRRVRDFAKGVGWDAKTDPIDAKLIAYYGEVVGPKPSVAKSRAEKDLTALVIRRRQLLKLSLIHI